MKLTFLGTRGEIEARTRRHRRHTATGSFVEGDERTLGARLREMAEDRGVQAEIAYDGMEVVLR